MRTRAARALAVFFGVCLFLAGCADRAEEPAQTPEEVTESAGTEDVQEETASEAYAPSQVIEESDVDLTEQILMEMTLEEKVAQMFIVLPEALVPEVQVVTAAGDATKEAYDALPVGGIIYLKQNLESPEQVKEMLVNMQAIASSRTDLPVFLCIDEEGGRISRIAGNEGFSITAGESAKSIGASGDTARAYAAGANIGGYLSELGFNVDFAPVADVLTNPDNAVIGDRAFGSDPQTVSDMALALAQGLMDNGVLPAYKHFPGHGGTSGDSHEGYAASYQTLEELRQCDLVPYQEGIANRIPFIMVGHIALPNAFSADIPASLDEEVITGILRTEMGYEGIVVTDAMNMGAVTEQYSSGEAACLAVEAGADMILMPADLGEAYQSVLTAVRDGRIPEERIDESVRRIIDCKRSLSE